MWDAVVFGGGGLSVVLIACCKIAQTKENMKKFQVFMCIVTEVNIQKIYILLF